MEIRQFKESLQTTTSGSFKPTLTYILKTSLVLVENWVKLQTERSPLHSNFSSSTCKVLEKHILKCYMSKTTTQSKVLVPFPLGWIKLHSTNNIRNVWTLDSLTQDLKLTFPVDVKLKLLDLIWNNIRIFCFIEPILHPNNRYY